MIEIELQIPDDAKTAIIVRIVEDVCVANDLCCALRGTLAKYPGSIHWHFKKSGQMGTLEITWWESQYRLWFKVARGRTSDWITDSLPLLKARLESEFLKSVYK